MRKFIAGFLLCVPLTFMAARLQDVPPELFRLWGADDALHLRGQVSLSAGTATVSLPSWFEGRTLPDNRTILVTCKDGWSPLWVSAVTNGQFTVSTNSSGNQGQSLSWQVTATLKPQ